MDLGVWSMVSYSILLKVTGFSTDCPLWVCTHMCVWKKDTNQLWIAITKGIGLLIQNLYLRSLEGRKKKVYSGLSLKEHVCFRKYWVLGFSTACVKLLDQYLDLFLWSFKRWDFIHKQMMRSHVSVMSLITCLEATVTCSPSAKPSEYFSPRNGYKNFF